MGVVDRTFKAGELVSRPVAAGQEIQPGELVNVNSSGYAKSGADDSGDEYDGVATEHVDNSGGSDGDKSVVVERRKNFRADVSGGYTDQAQVGAKVYVYDSETVAVDAADVSNDVLCGTIAQVLGSEVIVDQVRTDGKSYTRPTTTT